MRQTELPRGTVTMLFTDIEGSTRLLQQLGRERYVEALETHRRLLREAFTSHGGVEVELQGDSFHFAFQTAEQAVLAAAAGQRALAGYDWPEQPLRVRIGLHTGTPLVSEGLYAGLDVHRAARVMSAGHGGQVLVSQTTAELVQNELPEGLSLRDLGEHRLKDLIAAEHLFQLSGERLESDFPPLKTLENRPTNLPTQPTPLIGRERELTELRSLLCREDVRLVTLTGPGGTGKTRLALQAAAELVEDFPAGVFFVTLAALTDPALVIPTVLSTLSLRERPGEEPLDTLVTSLAGKRVLLVADNVEHLLPGVASPLGQLAARAPDLALLVTSRAPLRLSGEQEYPVSPLSASEALSLFAERARRVRPGFTLNGDRATVAEICERLDRLPLALELAAARLRVLPPRALLERLDSRLKLLTGGARDLPQRQQTLRAAIAWSYELLSAEEQVLFRRLSVFAGGWSLEAAEAVCDPDGALDALETLASLVEKSLVRQRETADGGVRFSLLGTVREFALEYLDASGEATDVRDRHADWCLELAARTDEELRRSGGDEGLARLSVDYDNVRAALRWLAQRAEEERLMALIARVGPFWYYRGHFTEALEWGERVLPAAESELTPTLAYALAGFAHVLAAQGDFARSHAIQSRLVAYYESLGDELAHAEALSGLAVTAVHRGDSKAAVAAQEQALELARRLGSAWNIALFTANLAEAFLASGDDVRALSLAREAADLARKARSGYILDFALYLQSLALLEQRQHDDADTLARQSLEIARESGDKVAMMWALDALAAASTRAGELVEAVRLAGAAAALERALAARRKPHEQRLRDDTLSQLREELDADTFAAAWREGEARVSPAGEYAAGDIGRHAVEVDSTRSSH